MRIALALVAALAARAHGTPDKPRITPMQVLDDGVCELLRADTKDHCAALAKSPLATIYQSGTKRGVRRIVLAIEQGERTLVGPAIDVLGEDCATGACVTLKTIEPTVRAVTLNGKAGVVLDLASSFTQKKDAWTTHTIVACSANRCAQLELGRCDATISDDGVVESSCGGKTPLAFE